MKRTAGLSIIGIIALTVTCSSSPAPTPTCQEPTSIPVWSIRSAPLAALFVGWYGFDPTTGECKGGLGSFHWNDTPNTAGVVHMPEQGYYCSADPTVVSKQLEEMRQAGIQVIIFSWWGWGDTNLDGKIEGHVDQQINKTLTEVHPDQSQWW